MKGDVSNMHQLGMFPDTKKGKLHICIDCRADISGKRRDAQRCDSCSKIRGRERANAAYKENPAEKLEYMKGRRQTPEYKRLRRAWEENNPDKRTVYRERKKQKHREKTGYNPEGRICEDCGVDISERGGRAKKCVPCTGSPARTCVVCDSDISHRGSRAKYCSESCKRQDRLLRALTEHTMVCRKCQKAKAFSEFRLRHNLRVQPCKTCEAKATREYNDNLTPEQKEIKRQSKNAKRRKSSQSIPQEQSILQKLDLRSAEVKRKYGENFNEYELYLAQDGRCAICSIPKPYKIWDGDTGDSLELDHDHVTGKPRGFLCKNCNFKLLPRYEKFPPEHQDSFHLNAYLLRGKL